ncbi:MAG: hypothetical protein JEZ09_07875 [Salinivirgaceae bacterium]|nr:hypothetical protein [Salinivirgaceae bacterium]
MRQKIVACFLMLSLGFLLENCSKIFENPYDPKVNKDSWKPLNLNVETQNISEVEIQWSQEEKHIEGFVIDREWNGEWIEQIAILEPKNTNWNDTTIMPDTLKSYTYRIKAFAGSVFSSPIQVSYTPQFPGPNNLTINKERDYFVELNWNDNSTGEQGFVIFKKANQQWVIYDTIMSNELTYNDYHIDLDSQISYKVQAYFKEFYSNSAEKEVMVQLMSPDSLKIESIGGNNLILNWNDNSSKEQGYIIEKKPDTGEWSNIGLTEPNVSSFHDVFDLGLQGVSYRVYAFNGEHVSEAIDASWGIPSISDINIINVTATSAKIKTLIIEKNGSDIINKGVCYNVYGSPTIDNDFVYDNTSSDSIIVEISNFDPDKTYYVRAFAKNSAGIAYSTQNEFTTLNGLPQLNTNEVSNINGTSATCGGYIYFDGGFEITQRGVCWGTNSNPTIEGGLFTADGTGTGTFSSNITGLNVDQSYYVRAYATNLNGTYYGDEKSFITHEFGSVYSDISDDDRSNFFIEDFDNNDNQWWVGSDDYGYSEISDGLWVRQFIHDGYYNRSLLAIDGINDLSNFEIHIRFKGEDFSQADQSAYNFLIWNSNNDGSYFNIYGLFDSGNFIFGTYNNDWNLFDIESQGNYNAFNQLVVRNYNGKTYLFYNEELIYTKTNGINLSYEELGIGVAYGKMSTDYIYVFNLDGSGKKSRKTGKNENSQQRINF